MIDGAIHVIPAPSRIRIQEGAFTFTSDSKVMVDRESIGLRNVALSLVDRIESASGVRLELSLTSAGERPIGSILYTTEGSDPVLGGEGYVLDIDPEGIRITASDPCGAFYGTQTLRQLLPSEIEGNAAMADLRGWMVPAVRIHDSPRFTWRGMMLDCCRHFMSVDFVKRYIGLLSHYKLNRFHWHLTDDQGWRIEIEKYPKLTDVGSWRTEPGGERYGGYYTKSQVRDVVQYALDRHVTVVPEIEMPGHATAALAAYPDLSCTGEPLCVATDWGIFHDVLCAGKETTFEFLQDVLIEVMELFPGEYVHIGGDECPKERWRECADCQRRMVEEALESEDELQGYFVGRIEAFLRDRGRRLIGWEDIVAGGPPASAMVQSWRSMNGAAEAAKLGHDVIVSPISHAYFDADIATTDLRQVYSFEPVPGRLAAGDQAHIIGGECNMWTEHAPQEIVDRKMFPRLLAMSECLWSQPANRDVADFHHRLQHHYKRLRELGVDYGE